jgi:hypothetical protein
VNPAEEDRLYLEAGVEQMRDYLLSTELFWPLTARGAKLPRLTISCLLLTRARVSVSLSSLEDQAFLQRMEQRLEAIRSKWTVAWINKCRREVRMRFDLWRNFLADYQESPGEYADFYHQEVRWRVMIELLLPELPDPPDTNGALDRLDETLRTSFISGDFVWDAYLEPAFPPEEFWFLYGSLRS